eukprot:338257-Amphidinium_carterae.1
MTHQSTVFTRGLAAERMRRGVLSLGFETCRRLFSPSLILTPSLKWARRFRPLGNSCLRAARLCRLGQLVCRHNLVASVVTDSFHLRCWLDIAAVSRLADIHWLSHVLCLCLATVLSCELFHSGVKGHYKRTSIRSILVHRSATLGSAILLLQAAAQEAPPVSAAAPQEVQLAAAVAGPACPWPLQCAS